MIFKSTSPFTGEVIAFYETSSNAEIEFAIDRADLTYQNDWRHRTVNDRATILANAASLLRERKNDFAKCLTMEIGKLIGEAYAEVDLTADILDFYATNSETYVRPKKVPGAPHASVRIEPVGVILAIEPWNFPLYQVARVAGPQLMVGNVLLLKHAEICPQSAIALEKLFKDAGAPPGVYTNLFASKEQIGNAIDDPRIRGISITGGEIAGASVAGRAGHALKKVVVELGGSDPLIIFDDSPLEPTIESAVAGRMFNNGQCCVGSKRIIVVGRNYGESFLSRFMQRLAERKEGDPLDLATSLAPLASERGLNLLLNQIDQAKRGGATVIQGGNRINRPGFFLQPTVITGINEGNPIFTQELFGPVAAFHVVDTEEEAIKLANATSYGLGASVFTANIERGQDVAEKIESGMVFINQPVWTAPELPFGGVKNSGFGRELSERGFYEFVNEKLINVAPPGASPWGPAGMH